jgi:hypothetical protein
MIVRQARFLSFILTAVCGLVVVTACQSTSTTNPRADLLRTINGANVDGYAFSFDEDATRSTSSLTNPAVSDVVTLGAGDNAVPLRYTTIRNRATNTATTYKTEIVRSGSSVSYVVTDLATNREVQRTSLGDDGTPPPDTGSCDQSCASFFHDYECNEKPRLQCEANKTCTIVHGHFRCRQPNGTCVDGPTVVTPNTPRCELRQTMVDIDRLVLRRP